MKLLLRVTRAGLVLAVLAASFSGCGRTELPVRGGGAEIMNALIEQLDVAEEPVRRGYERELFEQWVDLDGSGCTARHKVLAAQATSLAVTHRSLTGTPNCVVYEGEWELLFDGSRHVGRAADIDVDHVVALAEAWDSGAHSWDATQRRTFANDPLNLMVANRQVNKDKADLDAGDWKPSDPRSGCVTAAKMVLTKLRYELAVDSAERRGLIALSRSCDRADQRSIGGFPLPGTSEFARLAGQVRPS